jgi:hypothetical protein
LNGRPNVSVGVYPARALHERPRLFAALSELTAVDLLPVDRPGSSNGRPLIRFAQSGAESEDMPPRTLLIDADPATPGAGSVVTFGEDAALDRRVRGRALFDADAHGGTLAPRSGETVLASTDLGALWVRRRDGDRVEDVVRAAPPELAPSEVLRERLAPGRFMAVLPLLHFLREVGRASSWTPTQPSAAFVIDDPNLHWPSYGPLSFPALVRAGRECGYHTSIATVPVDAWYANRRAVGTFRDAPDALSLSVHGNDHRPNELGRTGTTREARAVLLRALQRVAALEARTGLSISRVMIPPFEACSAVSMQAMLETGWGAVASTRPRPWVPHGPEHSPYATADGSLLAGCRPADLSAHGLPVLIRRQFDDYDDVVLRAFLDQPIVLYGHVSDLDGGLEPLAAAAELINSLGDYSWSSLDALLRGNFETRRDGDAMEVRPFARHIRLETPADVRRVILRTPETLHRSDVLSATLDGRDAAVEDSMIVLPQGRSETYELEVRWLWNGDHVPSETRAVRSGPRILTRRLAAEGRDRLRPLARRARGRGGAQP